ncbi:MAG: hypothetical protein K2Z81_05745 [Cyanobacteria bacterium]|nr:hypothetical protein [Cyanobacteriota bacterium]
MNLDVLKKGIHLASTTSTVLLTIALMVIAFQFPGSLKMDAKLFAESGKCATSCDITSGGATCGHGE